MTPPSQPIARDIGLFLVLMIFVDGILIGLTGQSSVATLMVTFYLALFVHIWVTLYIGTFNGLRTATWLLLIGAWAGSETAAFLGYMLSPWDQLMRSAPGGVALTAVAFGLLGLDLIIMHYPTWRRRSSLQIALFLAAAIAVELAIAFILGWLVAVPSRPPEEAGIEIVPSWHILPLYALLRAVPYKTGGLVAMFAAVFVPMVWPWVRADMLRVGRMGWAWRLFCAGLAAAWLGLGFLGTLPPEGLALHAARILAILYFAFFLVLPFVLRRMA